MYRTRGRDRASQHNTPGTTGLENAGGAGGPGRDAGTRLAGPTRVRRASAKQISHAIRLNQISTNPENVAIPTMQIQCLNKLLGNCMRNCCADGPGRGAARRRWGLAGVVSGQELFRGRWQGRGSVRPGTVPGTVAGRQTRQNSPGTAPPPLNPRQNSPSNLKNVKFGVFRARRANFFAHRTR